MNLLSYYLSRGLQCSGSIVGNRLSNYQSILVVSIQNFSMLPFENKTIQMRRKYTGYIGCVYEGWTSRIRGSGEWFYTGRFPDGLLLPHRWPFLRISVTCRVNSNRQILHFVSLNIIGSKPQIGTDSLGEVFPQRPLYILASRPILLWSEGQLIKTYTLPEKLEYIFVDISPPLFM